MMTVKTSSWSATYDKATNAWTSQDGMIARYLNTDCVPGKASDAAALDAVQAKFPNVVMDVDAPAAALAADADFDDAE